MGKTDKAWEILFDRHNIIKEVETHGFFEIGAKEIKREREPRLMAKFDHYHQLPEIFKKNGFSILPISRSSYVIGEFDVYQSVTYNDKLKPINVDFPKDITTIDPTNLYSESSALHCAHVTGMMEQVLGEMPVQTISGRMSSKEFDFSIRTSKGMEKQIEIKNSQIEIDGGYESQHQFMLVEAKNVKVDDFLVRQIYYPYRLWSEKTHKLVKPVFFTLSNDIFSFFIYEFTDPKNYNSLVLVEQKDFIISTEKLKFRDIIDMTRVIEMVPEPEIPFPQADSFTKVVDLLGLLFDKDMNTDEVTAEFVFDVRQTGYYTSAGMYLGLVEKYKDAANQTMYRLSQAGREIMKQRTKDKFFNLARCILSHEVFNKTFLYYLDSLRIPEKRAIVEIMKKCNIYNVHSDHTYNRRASTVSGWIKWILDLEEIYS